MVIKIKHLLRQKIDECHLGAKIFFRIYLQHDALIQVMMSEVVRDHHFRFKVVSRFWGATTATQNN